MASEQFQEALNTSSTQPEPTLGELADALVRSLEKLRNDCEQFANELQHQREG